MTRRKKTDGERIAGRARCVYLDHGPWEMQAALTMEIDRIIRRRMAEAWGQGWCAAVVDKKWSIENPYVGRRKK